MHKLSLKGVMDWLRRHALAEVLAENCWSNISGRPLSAPMMRLPSWCGGTDRKSTVSAGESWAIISLLKMRFRRRSWCCQKRPAQFNHDPRLAASCMEWPARLR